MADELYKEHMKVSRCTKQSVDLSSYSHFNRIAECTIIRYYQNKRGHMENGI